MSKENNKILRLAIAGVGTVGAGVINLLQARPDLPFKIVAISARDRHRDRGISMDGIVWYDDPLEMAEKESYDIYLELIGGSSNQILNVWNRVLTQGKAMVTANKALLASHGEDLAKLALKHDGLILGEAAVAGGIPALKVVRDGMSGNHISRVAGIFNGTCNYILTEMAETGRGFKDVLAEAQALGYAETDPSADVGGFDAADKLVVLIRLAFGLEFLEEDLPVRGIADISTDEINFAASIDHRVKLVAQAAYHDGKLSAWVEPVLIPLSASLAIVNGVTNAVQLDGDRVGSIMITGPGAGGDATASAVVADLIDVKKDRAGPIFGTRENGNITSYRKVDDSDDCAQFYIRAKVHDRIGVIGLMGNILADKSISIHSISQHVEADDQSDDIVTIVIITHNCTKLALHTAIDAINQQDWLEGEVLSLRFIN